VGAKASIGLLTHQSLMHQWYVYGRREDVVPQLDLSDGLSGGVVYGNLHMSHQL
jgi:hypothetical protein